MEEYGAKDIKVLRPREAVRWRLHMYIGGENESLSPRVRLLECAVRNLATGPLEIRLLLWRDDAVTIAYDGDPLPVELIGRPVNNVPHPALYRLFLDVHVGGGSVSPSFAVLNMLSDFLFVSTMHAGDCYRTTFAKGGIVEPLRRSRCRSPLGVTWLTYTPDTTLITGEVLTLDEVQGVAERLAGC